MSATAKKQKPLKRHPSKLKRMSAYMILAIILISIMAVLFGVFLVIDGMMTLQDGVDCARARLAGWWVPALLGAVTIALGCVVLFGKFDSIMLLAGISLIADGVFDLIVTLAFSKRIRTAREKLRIYANGPIIDSEKVDD